MTHKTYTIIREIDLENHIVKDPIVFNTFQELTKFLYRGHAYAGTQLNRGNYLLSTGKRIKDLRCFIVVSVNGHKTPNYKRLVEEYAANKGYFGPINFDYEEQERQRSLLNLKRKVNKHDKIAQLLIDLNMDYQNLVEAGDNQDERFFKLQKLLGA